MKIFPTKKYSITLKTNSSDAISELQKTTLSDEQFVADWNKQTFIGKIRESEFEVKLSKKTYGALCVLKGKLEKDNGILEISVNRIFKIIIVVFYLWPIVGFIISLIKYGFKNSTDLIFITIMFPFFVRFAMVELIFRIVSNIGLNKLIKIIGIKKINVAQHRL